MNISQTLLIALAAALLPGTTALAQGSSSTNTNQEVFRVSFFASCQSFDSTRGRIVTTRLTDRDIIAQALGTSPSDRSVIRNFALAYNATADSLQVVDSNLQAVVDVIHFGGGVAIADNRRIDRFTFLFFPGQTNEFGAETNVFGSAVITEQTNRFALIGRQPTPKITGRLQFFLAGGNVLGETNQFTLSSSTNFAGITNAISGTNIIGLVTSTNSTGLPASGFVMTNSNIVFDSTAVICVGTFTTTGRAAVLTPGMGFGAITNGVGTTNTVTTTNTTTGVNGTNGVFTTTNASNTATGTGIGFNTGIGTLIGIGNSGTAIGFGSGAIATPGVAGVTGPTAAGTPGVVTGTTGVGPVGAATSVAPTIGNTVGTTATIGNTAAVGTTASTVTAMR